MKRNLVTTLLLSCSLIIFGFFVFTETSDAQKKEIVLPLLLEIPAPPPVNPYFQVVSNKRSEGFFDAENPPPDNAPIQDLLDYWSHQNNRSVVYDHTLKPSDTVARRIINEIDKTPKLLPNFLFALSHKQEFADEVKRIFERERELENIPNYRKRIVKEWLGLNSDYAIEDLERAASQVRDTREYVTNQNHLLALAKVDFERAKPILENLVENSNQPASKTLAHWAMYLNAIKEEDSIEADRHRSVLMDVVEDKTAKPGIRDMAFDALVYGGDFPGRDEWYFSLLEDETLAELRVGGRLYTGLTTMIMREPPDKYVDKMIELVKSKNRTVRNAAARNLGVLIENKNPKVIEALLPWLEDPDWAKELDDERRNLVNALQSVRLPESVPGLIEMLNEKHTRKVRKGSYDYEILSNTAVSMAERAKAMANEAAEIAESARAMANSAKLMAENDDTGEVEYYPYRGAAITALANQKDLRAAQALRQILPETPKDHRDEVVKAILASGGFSVLEQLDALEELARKYENIGKEWIAEMEKSASEVKTIAEAPVNKELIMASPIRITTVRGIGDGTAMIQKEMVQKEIEPFDPAEVKPLLGDALQELEEPDYELVKTTANRIAYLETREPYVAVMLKTYLQNWGGAAVNAVLLDDLRTGKADVDTIIKLLSLRKTLREKQSNEVINAKSGGDPVASAVAACIFENQGEYFNIFKNGSTDAKIALLGCGRLIRAEFPVKTVAELLDDPNKLLNLAALRYLETVNSPEAQNIVYQKSPKQIPILGARFFFGEEKDNYIFDPDFLYDLFISVNPTMSLERYFFYMEADEDFEPLEARLRAEIAENSELLGIYAYENNFVRIYKNQAVFSWEEDEARYRERILSEKEFDYLKEHLAANNVSELPPFIGSCGGCEQKQLTMIGRDGGRRVFVSSDRLPGFFEELENIFTEFRKPPAKLRYWLEKDVADLEILFEDEMLKAVNVWKNGDDLRLFVNDLKRQAEIEKEIERQIAADMENAGISYMETLKRMAERKNRRQTESFYWIGFANGKTDRINSVGEPAGFKFIPPETENELYESILFKENFAGIIANYSGLTKIANGELKTLIEGNFDNAINTEEGKWAIALKRVFSEEPDSIVIVNLQTERITEVKLEQYSFKIPTTYNPSLGGFLIRVGKTPEDARNHLENANYVVLNPENGNISEIKGELRPLIQQTSRSLQPLAKNNQRSWAAIPIPLKGETAVGIYDAQNFKFETVMKVPRILFDSMNMWVDESEKKIYIIYESQLISIPLKSAEKDLK